MSIADVKPKIVGFGWDAIDIFLFSNGQQSSPPRKYHLRTNELDWWEATLNYLARSHYGTSNTAIELYTLDGSKVKGPLELSNGMPYVAVVPPDTFTDAGYEKYLMKASRSWEKRKAKKDSSAEEPEVVNIECVANGVPLITCCLCVIEDSGELSNISIGTVDKGNMVAPLYITLYSANVSHLSTVRYRLSNNGRTITNYIGSQQNDNEEPSLALASELLIIKNPDETLTRTSIYVKPERSAARQPRSIITPPSNTRNERRRSNGPSTSFEKTGSLTSERSKRNPSLTKGIIQTKSIKKISIKTSEQHLKSKGTVNYLNGRHTTNRPPASRPASPPKCPGMTTVTSKALATDSLPIHDLISDKEILLMATDTNLNQNLELHENEINSLHVTHNPSVVDDMTNCNIPVLGVEEETQTQVDIYTCEVNTITSEILSNSNNKIKVYPATLTSESNIIHCDIPLGDNCIAVINKGDAVTLHLNIEVQNVATNSSEHKNKPSNVNQCARKASSLSDLFKKKKSDHEEEQSAVPTKSLESVLCNINECYAKVVMVQCSCCGNKTAVPRINTLPMYKDPNGFFILLPTANQYDNNCTCCPNHQRLYPDKAGISACVEDLCKPKSSTIYPCVPQDVGMVMTITGSMGSQTGEFKRNVADILLAKRGLHNDFVYFNKCRRSAEGYGTSPSPILKVEYVVSTSEMPKALPYHSRVDSFTQTEWCSVLLEAQQHADGRYSFHLPPLQVLKYYSLV